MRVQADRVSPSRSSWRRGLPNTTANLWSLRVKLLSVSKAAGGLPENMCQTCTRSLRARAATATLRLPFRAKRQKGLSTLDQEMAEVTTASFTQPEFDGFAHSALALAGVECHGFSSVARLRLKATGAGSRLGLVHRRKVAVRHSGSCAPRWCFPPRFNHRLEQLAQRHHRTFGPSATRARCKHSRVPQGTLTKFSRFAQRRFLHDFIPSQIDTDDLSNSRVRLRTGT